MYFVVDTNTLVSAIIKPDGLPMRALLLAQEKGQLIFNEETSREIVNVLNRPKFNKYISLEERLTQIENILLKSKIVAIESSVNIICRDDSDIKFLHLAMEWKASCLITGDFDLKDLHPFRGIPIYSCSEFIDWIRT